MVCSLGRSVSFEVVVSEKQKKITMAKEAIHHQHLCIGYDGETKSVSHKMIADLSKANPTDYIHFKHGKDMIPITITTCNKEKDQITKKQTQYFVMDKEEVQTIKSCKVQMKYGIEINIADHDDGKQIHVIVAQKGRCLDEFHSTRSKIDGLMFVIYVKTVGKPNGKVMHHFHWSWGNKFTFTNDKPVQYQ